MAEDAPITAYHGSPHDFDEFDTSKIGTGEGAQAYGHGLYFAEHEPVAEGYRNRLAGHIPGAVKIGDETHPHWARKDVAKAFAKLGYDPQTSVIAAHQIDEHKGDLDKASAELWENEHIPDSVHDALHKAEYATPAGHMYEVAIDAHPDHMLDWDQPLHDQDPHVVKSLFEARHDNPTLYDAFKSHLKENSKGMNFYQALAVRHPNGYEGASNFLQRAGIPGIRYLDANSRSATEKPTRNYVVFDKNRVKVKRKYEQGGYVERTKRATGGRIPEVDKLFKSAKRTLDGETKPMLNMHDDDIVKALRIAQGRI